VADISIGTIIATLKLDTSSFGPAMAATLEQLQRLGQQAISQTGYLGQMAAGLGRVDTATQASAAATMRLTQQMTLLNQQAISQTGLLGQMATQLGQVQQAATTAAPAVAALGTSWQSILGIAAGVGIATSVTALVSQMKSLVTESVSLAAKMQDLHRSFTAIEGSGSAANRTLGFLFTTAQRLGVDFTTAAEGFKRLDQAAKGGILSGDDIRRVYEGVAAGARALGSSSQQSQSAIIALEQMLTKGKLSAEEYQRQLGNAVPGGLQIMARGLGVTTEVLRQMVQAGVIPATVAVVAFGAEMGRLGTQSTGPITGISATFARLRNETTAWMTALGEAIAAKLVPFLEIITKISAGLREMLNIQGPGQQPVPSKLPIEPSPYTGLIQQEAQRQGIDPGLLSRLIKRESGFDPTLIGKAGEIGLGQLKLGTAQDLEMGVTAENLKEPERNIRLSAKYLAEQLNRFRDSTEQTALALAAYNAGPTRVQDILDAAKKSGGATGFAQLDLPPSSKAYAAGIMGLTGPVGANPFVPSTSILSPTMTQGPAAGQVQVAKDVTDTWKKTIEETLKQFPELRAQIDNMAKSGANFNDILGKGVKSQADDLITKFASIGQYLTRFPEEAAKLDPVLRARAEAGIREAAIFQVTLGQEEKRRDLVKAQVEDLENLIVQRKADLLTLSQGQDAAARYTREAQAALAAERLKAQPTLAGQTFPQQIAGYTARLQALTGEANTLGTQVEAAQAKLKLPELEAQLIAAQAFLSKPVEDAAQQARDAVEKQGAAMAASWQKALQTIRTTPGLGDAGATLAHGFDAALAALPAAVEAESQKAYDKVVAQQQAAIATITQEVTQFGLQVSAAGLKPLDADLERITRTFDEMGAKLLALHARLGELRKTATPEGQAAIDLAQANIKDVLPQLDQKEVDARLERMRRPEVAELQRLQDRLDQLQTPRTEGFFGQTRESVRLQQKSDEAIQTGGGRLQAQALLDQIRAQERLNYAVKLFEDFGQSVGQSWTNALLSIADHTKTVGQAFREMARSILQSIIQITSQEAWKSLIRLGVGLLTSAVTGGITQGVTTPGGGIYQAPIGGGAPFNPPPVAFAAGGVVNRPTIGLVGENSSTVPEIILNKPEIQGLFSAAMRAAPTAGGQAAGGQGIVIMNFPSQAAAEQSAADQRALGKQVILNEVLNDLGRGEASKISRVLRMTQR